MIPLAREPRGRRIVLPADVQDAASLDALFARIAADWGRLDFLVHAIAYSDKAELDGRFLDTSRANFLQLARHLLLQPGRPDPAGGAVDDRRAARS